jgi:hypothetical protein
VLLDDIAPMCSRLAPKWTINGRLAVLPSRPALCRPILILRKHLDMIDDEQRDGACLRFQSQPELLLDGR